MLKYVKNTTLSYILPMISDKEYNKDFFINEYFRGCYLEDSDRDNKGDILLKYQFIPTYKYMNTLDERLIDHPNYLYDYNKGEDAIYVFKLPEGYTDDLKCILDEYISNISPELKLKISKFWGDTPSRIKVDIDQEVL